MLTLTQQENLYGELTTGTANTTNISFGRRIINAETRRLVAKMSDNLLHTTGTAQASANLQVYELPVRVKKIRGITFTLDSTTQPVRKSPNREHWDSLNTATSTSYTSDFPEWYYIIGRKIYYWPTPASSTAYITYDYDVRFIDSSISDYTTGGILTATNGSAVIVGTATSWGSAMVGRYLQVNKSDTYANDGDGDYYEIASVSSATAMVLIKTYAGHSISSGNASYRIGEISPLPDGFHELPVYRATHVYYSKVDKNQSIYFANLSNELEAELFNANDPSDLVVVEDTDEIPSNPNLFPRNIG